MNPTQETIWNGTAGDAWVRMQPALDGMFQPFVEMLAGEVDGGRTLDVGCGAGATTLALSRAGECLGVDISAPLIAAARARAAQEGSRARFLVADAGVHPFDAAGFDWIISRFGVMFFDEPAAAFANLHRAAAPGGRARFFTWRSPAENPFMTVGERAVAPLVPGLPQRVPDAPGQFGLADAARARRLMREGGWRDVELTPVDVECVLPQEQLEAFFTRLGPVGQLPAEMDGELRRRVVETLHGAYAPFVTEGAARFTAACWMIRAGV